MKFRKTVEQCAEGRTRIVRTVSEYRALIQEFGVAHLEHAIWEENGKMLDEFVALFMTKGEGDKNAKAIIAWLSGPNSPLIWNSKTSTFGFGRERKASGLAKDWGITLTKEKDGTFVKDSEFEKFVIRSTALVEGRNWWTTVPAEVKPKEVYTKEKYAEQLKKLQKKAADAGLVVASQAELTLARHPKLAKLTEIEAQELEETSNLMKDKAVMAILHDDDIRAVVSLVQELREQGVDLASICATLVAMQTAKAVAAA